LFAPILGVTVVAIPATGASSPSFFTERAASLGPAAAFEQHVAPADDVQPPLPSTTVFQSSEAAGPMSNPLIELLSRVRRDYPQQLTFPFRTAWHHPVGTGLGVAGLVGLIAADPQTMDWLSPKEEVQENGITKAGQKLAKYGGGPYAGAVVLAFAGVGWLGNSPREKDTAMMLTEALALSGAWTGALKLAFGRQRPRESEARASDWTGPFSVFQESGSNKLYESFPSGHATGAFALATILAKQYPARHIVPALAYTGAAVMAYSRMTVQAHWLSDVVVGGLIGYATANQVWNANHDSGYNAHDTKRVSLGADYSPDFKGVHVDVPLK
jgi:hypothetical protein